MKNITIVAIITSILSVLLLLNTCRLNKKIDKQEGQITTEQLKSQKLDSTINTNNQTIYTQKALITSNQKVIKQLTDTVFSLKSKDQKNLSVIAYYQGKTTTTLSKITVPYLDTAYMKHFEDSVQQNCSIVLQYIQDSTIKIGRKSGDSTPNYTISQTVQKDGIKIDSLSIPDVLSLRFVEKKGNLFRPSSFEVQYFHSNPLIKTTSSNSVFYVPKRKSFFQRVILPIGIGVGAGILIAK